MWQRIVKKMKHNIFVKAGSSKEEVIDNGSNLIVYVRAKAHDGEANTAIVKVLAEYFKVSKSQVKIVHGIKSRHKIIEIS